MSKLDVFHYEECNPLSFKVEPRECVAHSRDTWHSRRCSVKNSGKRVLGLSNLMKYFDSMDAGAVINVAPVTLLFCTDCDGISL
jgi:hypothetical protein